MVLQRITEVLTQRSLYTENLLHTEAFTHTSFSTEAFTQRSFWARAFTHRRLYKQKLVHTGGFYAQKLLHREAFTHKRFPTEKTIPQSSFYTFQKVAILRFWRSAIISCERGCIRRWKIAIFDVAQSFCVTWVAPDLVKSHFYTSFISRETVVPHDPKWIKSQFYTNSWTVASDVKISVFPQLLPFDFHATLASELSKYTSFWWLTLISCEGAAPGPAKFAFCHVFGCPTCAISVSTDGCCGPKDKQDPHFATRLGVRHATEGNVS